MTSEERRLGIRLAGKHGLIKTARAISFNACYRVIFQTAVKETDSVDKTIDILKEAKDPKWAYWFARYTPNLTETQIDTLFKIVVEAKNPDWAYFFARDIPNLTENQKEQLRAITA